MMLAACVLAARIQALMAVPVRQLRNDQVRRQNSEAEDGRCSKMPGLHCESYSSGVIA